MPKSDPDLFDSMVERLQEGTADRLERRMREATRVKNQEDASSKQRLEEMWMREHARQQAAADAQIERIRQEKMLIRLVLIGAVTVVVIVIVLTFVLNQTGGETELGSWLHMPSTILNV